MPIDAVKTLSCDLLARHSASVSEVYEPEKKGGRLILTFTDLDRERGLARLTGNQASTSVSYEVASFAGNPQAIFLERTLTGSLNSTSVFFSSGPPGSPFDDKNPTLRGPSATAVHSRHILIGGIEQVPTAVVSQYVGACRLN